MPAKTAVFILNYNLPDVTDHLHGLLNPYQGEEYDLFVLDNGSTVEGMAASTTHRLEENLFWGGALNWAFRFILQKKQYDSLLFLNNDISLNPVGFVTGLRRELFIGSFHLVTPCLAGPAQPWPQMQCWYSGRTRTVKWIDMQAPMFHRELIEKIGQFSPDLDYGWGQELVCARACERNSWATGIADHICIEHQGEATLKKLSEWDSGQSSDSQGSLKDFHHRARSAYETLINSDPEYYESLVQWSREYDLNPEDRVKTKPAQSPDHRTEIINRVINRFDYQRYLEIGVGAGENFNSIKAETKVGVDPDPSTKIEHDITSDCFFADLDPDTDFDLVFLDGLHEEKQVLRDIHNSLKHLAPGGMILVSCCNPPTEAHQFPQRFPREWCGTTWKTWSRLRCTRPDLEMCVIDIEQGIGVIRKGSQVTFQNEVNKFDWELLDKERERLLNLVTSGAFFANLE